MLALKSSPHRARKLLVFSWETRRVVPVLPGSFGSPNGCILHVSKTLTSLKSPISGGPLGVSATCSQAKLLKTRSSRPGHGFPVGPCHGRVCRRRGGEVGLGVTVVR